MISYTDFVEKAYRHVRDGCPVRDLYNQIIICDKQVYDQMALHNREAFYQACSDALDPVVSDVKARAKLVDLFKDAFYQLAAMNESKLRRLYEQGLK
jgi:hypothetical protein